MWHCIKEILKQYKMGLTGWLWVYVVIGVLSYGGI